MKIVFVAGSRKFYADVERAAALCRTLGMRAATAGKLARKDTARGEKEALRRAFGRIDASDALYVVARHGYVGRAVSLEIGYAYAHGKPVIASELLRDLAVRALVSGVSAPTGLARYIRRAKKSARR
ncbi:hypothetical protein HYS54_03305 [Candidatus Micrarchaeota archaeon]|nr:hypothetical protein [Candidatus Micrarchaeota archaeon]